MHSYELILKTIVFCVSLGIFTLVFSRKLRIPSIPLLIIVGVLFGEEGLGIINVDVFGPFLRIFISISVAIILFEGGLTLDYSNYRNLNKVIRRLLSVGILTTWLSISLFIYLIFSYSISFSLLAGSLVIVTGPTVILPLLRRVKPKKDINQILHWEGVLNDPIGVFIGILCFEIVGKEFAFVAISQFFLQFLTGIILGCVFGFSSCFLLKRNIIPRDLTNIFVLGIALTTFGVCDFIVKESGLLAVVVAGLIIGIKKPIPMESLRKFKLELTQIFIAIVFILLSSKINILNFKLFGFKGIWLILFVILVARPLSVFLSTFKSNLSLRDKLFISWIAPRGVIAASIATLFSVSLKDQGVENTWFLETFTFMVIITTVIIQGFTAGLVAKVLKVKKSQLNSCLVIGIHLFSESIADFLSSKGKKEVIFLDKNKSKIDAARKKGYTAFLEDSMDPNLLEDERFSEVGVVLSLTDNEELNTLLCQQWSKVVGRKNVYCWVSFGGNQGVFLERVGKPIWTNFPRLSVISDEIQNSNTTLHVLNNNKKNIRDKFFLLGIVDGRLIFNQNERSLLIKKKQLVVSLYLSRKKESIMDLLKKDKFVFYSSIKDFKGVLNFLLKKIISKYPVISKDFVLNEFLSKNKKEFTNLDEEILFPHLFLKEINTSILCVVKLSTPIKFEQNYEKPVKLIFFNLIPSNDIQKHLAILSRVANFLMNRSYRNKLLEASSKEELLSILKV